MFYKFFGNRRLLVLLASIILLVAIMGVTVGPRANITWPEKFIRDVVSWGQTIIYRPANMVAGFFEDIHSVSVLYEENKKLKESLHKHAQTVAQLYELEAENKRLKNALDFKSTANDYELRASKVIGRNPDQWNNMIIIDKGSKDGIKENMGVISTEGYLVGRVHATTPYSSQIQLISDTSLMTRVSAFVQAEKDAPFGIVEGYNEQSGMLSLTKVPLEVKLKKGDRVTTAGWGNVFPAGILIGEIEQVVAGDFGLTQNAEVKPAADLNRLNEVFIVEKSYVVPEEFRESLKQPVDDIQKSSPELEEGTIKQ